MASFNNFLQSITLASMLLAAPAFAQQVSTDYDHTANFSQYHTYSWHQVKTSNPLDVQRIKDAVDRDLSSKAWQMVPSGGNVSFAAVCATHTQQHPTTSYSALATFRC